MLIGSCACWAVWFMKDVDAVFTAEWNTLFAAVLVHGPWYLTSQQQCMCFSLTKSSSNLSSHHCLLPHKLRWEIEMSTESVCLLCRGYVSCFVSCQRFAPGACSYAIRGCITLPSCFPAAVFACTAVHLVGCWQFISTPVMYACLDSCSSTLAWFIQSFANMPQSMPSHADPLHGIAIPV